MVHALAIAPHPDDAEIFCGGTIALLASLNYQVGVLDLTRGELASQGTVEIRNQETATASAAMRITVRENLGFQDGFISETSDFQVKELVAALRRLQPQLILAPYSEDRHPDHAEASKLSDRAIFMAHLRSYQPELGSPHLPLQVIYYQFRTSFKPSFLVNVTSSYEAKLAGIKAYASQLNRTRTDSTSLVSSPLSLSSIVARDEYYGSMLGVKYAEPFFTKTALGISDPIAFFRSNSILEPLASPES